MDTNRLLAAEETASLDYTVFSVVIATLVIVLVVEVLRHQLDVAASGNPFFQTVLELMYRECEFWIVVVVLFLEVVSVSNLPLLYFITF